MIKSSYDISMSWSSFSCFSALHCNGILFIIYKKKVVSCHILICIYLQCNFSVTCGYISADVYGNVYICIRRKDWNSLVEGHIQYYTTGIMTSCTRENVMNISTVRHYKFVTVTSTSIYNSRLVIWIFLWTLKAAPNSKLDCNGYCGYY